MKPSAKLYFIALLPPVEVADEVTEIKQSFARNYGSRAALKSPPHVTLQPPFAWEIEEVGTLKESLVDFTQFHAPIPLILSGFGAFPPRVIYVNVVKTPELMQVQATLVKFLRQQFASIAEQPQHYSFSPHMTVAFRDLKKRNFHHAWPQFQERSISYKFTVSELTLLSHDGHQWHVDTQFPFAVK